MRSYVVIPILVQWLCVFTYLAMADHLQSVSHQTQRLGALPIAEQADKKRSIGLGDLSYSYTATDIGSKGGSHVKTITVIKNVKLPKNTDSKDFKPDDWVKHVDTHFKMVHNIPEIPEVHAFNYLPIDVGHKKPPVVATVAPPNEEKPSDPVESDSGSKVEHGKMDGSDSVALDQGNDSVDEKITDDAETLNEDADIGFEEQAQHDRSHVFKVGANNINRQKTYSEALPEAMHLQQTTKQPKVNKVSDDLEFIRLGPHSIRTEDAVRSRNAQVAWNNKNNPQQKQTDSNHPLELGTKINKHIESGTQNKETQHDTILEDFSDYSMHNVKHKSDPLKARKIPVNIHYTVDFSSPNQTKSMPSPLSHQAQQQSTDQKLSLKFKKNESANLQVESESLKSEEADRVKKPYSNKQLQTYRNLENNIQNIKPTSEVIDDGSMQWSAYSDSDNDNTDTQVNDNSKPDIKSYGNNQLDVLQAYDDLGAYISKQINIDSLQESHEQILKPNNKIAQAHITLQNAHLRASNDFVAYDTIKQGKLLQSSKSGQRNGQVVGSDRPEPKKLDDIHENTHQGYHQREQIKHNNASNSRQQTQKSNYLKETSDDEDKNTNKYQQLNSKNEEKKTAFQRSNNSSKSTDSESYETYQQPSNAPKPKPYAAPSIQKTYSTSSTTTQRMPYMAPIKSRGPMQFYIINAPTTSTQRPYLSPSVYKSYSLNLEQIRREQDKLATERELLEQQQQHEERTQLMQLKIQQNQPLRDDFEEEKPRAEKLQLSRDQGDFEDDAHSENRPHQFDKYKFGNANGKSTNTFRIPQDVEVFSEMTPIKSQSYRTATHEELRVTSPRPRNSNRAIATTMAPSSTYQSHFADASAASAPNRIRPAYIAVSLDASTSSPYVADPSLGDRKIPPHLARHPLVFDSNPPHSFLESPFRLSLKPQGRGRGNQESEFLTSEDDEP